MAELFGDSSEGPPATANELFQPLPYPENITVTAINPRLVGISSSYTFSVDLTIDWEHPQFQTDIDNYEISFSDVALREFDRFNDRSEIELISNDTTQFRRVISEEISDTSPQLFVQVYMVILIVYQGTILGKCLSLILTRDVCCSVGPGLHSEECPIMASIQRLLLRN